MDVQDVLAQPIAAQLLRGSSLARLAYVARDGTPRVIPTGFLWKAGTFRVWTLPDAAKVAALRERPAVALTIDHDGFPPRALLIRGTAVVTVVPGVPDGYVEASLKTESGRAAEDFGAGVRAMYDEMAEITIVPGWARCNDFESTLPKAVEDVLRRKSVRI